MAKMKLISIPAAPKRSFDNRRKPSELVIQQVKHAHGQLKKWIAENADPPASIDTEQEAADYINAVTRVLHPEGTPAEPSEHSVIDLGGPGPSGRTKTRPSTKAQGRQRQSRGRR